MKLNCLIRCLLFIKIDYLLIGNLNQNIDFMFIWKLRFRNNLSGPRKEVMLTMEYSQVCLVHSKQPNEKNRLTVYSGELANTHSREFYSLTENCLEERKRRR